jgi:nicotinamidase-related amidase
MAVNRQLVEPRHTAIVMNECQRGVVGDLSSLAMLAEAAAPAMENLGRLAKAARAAGVQVVHCVAKGRADGKGSNRNNRMAGLARRRREAGEATVVDPEAFAQVVDVIGVDDADLVMSRLHGMSPMSDTGLDPVLRNLGVSTVIVGGVSLNVGVTNLAMDAMNRGYDVVVPRDASVGVPAEYGEQMLEHTLSMVARLTTTDELIGFWAA